MKKVLVRWQKILRFLSLLNFLSALVKDSKWTYYYITLLLFIGGETITYTRYSSEKCDIKNGSPQISAQANTN